MNVQFAELPVRDQDRAKAFYTTHLNSQVAADQPMGKEGWRWIELKFPAAETALHFVRQPEHAASDEPVLVLVDRDVEVTVKAPKSQGVSILSEPHSPPWQPGRMIAEFRDSEGNRMVIASP